MAPIRRWSVTCLLLPALLIVGACKSRHVKHPALKISDVNRTLAEGREEFLSQKYREALEPFTSLVVGDVGSAAKSEAAYWAGFCYIKLGNYPKAEESFHLALEKLEQPYLVGPARAALADSLAAQGKFESAEREYARALKKYASYVDADVIRSRLANARRRHRFVPSKEAASAPGVSADKTTYEGTGGGRYTLQLGAFKSRAEARKLVKRLEDRGFAPFIQLLERQGRQLFCVRVGNFSTKGDADATQKRIKLLGFDAFLVK